MSVAQAMACCILQGCTALLLAVQYEAEEIVRLLLGCGADVNTVLYRVSIHISLTDNQTTFQL